MSRYVSRVPLDDAWAGLVDDAAIFPPGDAPLHEATAAYGARIGRGRRRAGRAPSCSGTPTCRWCAASAAPLSVVVTGGAGQLAGPAGLCAQARAATWPGWRSRCATSTTWPATPAGSSPRSTTLETECAGLRRAAARPARPRRWLAAADVVAEAELRLKFRTGGLDAAAFPTAEALAALDRRRAGPRDAVQVHGRLHSAVRHTGEDGFEHHGFLNVLVATRRAFDGAALRRGGRRAGAARRPRCRRARASSTSPARGAGSPRSARARSPSRWADLRELGLVA